MLYLVVVSSVYKNIFYQLTVFTSATSYFSMFLDHLDGNGATVSSVYVE